jgi:glycosyltransferase involved in cell wall biosynthesis
MDGGSTDNSVEVIKKYEAWLTYWVSEKDKGQGDAIYRGFEKSTGEVIAWINSDDFYMPQAFNKVATLFCKHKCENKLLIGSCFSVDETGRKKRKFYGFPQTFHSLLLTGMHFLQPACFWDRISFFATGGYDKSLQHCFDYDLFLRLTKSVPIKYTMANLAADRHHPNMKRALLPHVQRDEWGKLLIYNGIQSIDENHRVELLRKAIMQKRLYRLLGIVSDILYDPIWFLMSFPSKIKVLSVLVTNRFKLLKKVR